eukprot:TRINITY_DN5_c0_g2_i1.p2 TRINITY_DN5_c0_g2~~TRINITY_DN5_c0_g2_i1.p2  ORF type:complete len:573 (-),score=117.46 TRINITY_DN5_c0_g2_i1:2813-4531(-)
MRASMRVARDAATRATPPRSRYAPCHRSARRCRCHAARARARAPPPPPPPPLPSSPSLGRPARPRARMRPLWRRALPASPGSPLASFYPHPPPPPPESVTSEPSTSVRESARDSFSPKLQRQPPLRRLHQLFLPHGEARRRENLRSTKRRVIKLRRQPDDAPVRLSVGFRSRTGWEPIRVAKENQDCLVALVPWGPESQFSFLAALDGHGRHGHHCSMFIAQRVEAYLLRSLLPNRHDPQYIADALHCAMMYAEHKLEAPPVTVDYSLSGSTGTFVLIHGTTLYCANVGDSRAILGRVQPQLFETHRSQPFPFSEKKRARVLPDHYTAIPISIDQKPSRPDEMQRLLAAGARVDEWEGVDVGETRVWRPDVRSPGLAVSRSFGDLEVKRYGVNCNPEIFSFDLHPDDHFLVLGSDGIFEFLSNDDIIAFVASCREEGSAQEAAEKLVKLATEKWIEDDSIIDDISCIVVFLQVMSETVSSPQLPRQLHASSPMPAMFGSAKSSTASEFSPGDRVTDHIVTSSPPPYVGHSSLEFPQRPRAISVHNDADLETFANTEAVDRNLEEYDDALEIV